MNINTTLFGWLSSDTALMAMVGDRIYPVAEPQKETLEDPQEDVIVFSQISESEDDVLGGLVFRKPVFAFLCGSQFYDRAHDVAEALKARMRALVYPAKHAESDGSTTVQLENVVLRDCRDDYRFIDQGIFTVYVEYEVHYQ